ncbi:MAG: hypothetical protein ACUVX1_15735 [Chloroflexota bacterium]
MALELGQIQRMQNRSVQSDLPVYGGGVVNLVFNIAAAADAIIPWGYSPAQRDMQLRRFWPTEPWLAGAVYSLSARDAALSWTLDGPPRTRDAVHEILHGANFGAGWLDFITKLRVDLFTTDNGAFIELIRAEDSPTSPVIGIANLDSGRCVRTGNRETPVLYTDIWGGVHKLKWYHVICLTEFPSPVESMNGMQLCAVSRVLRMAQILRDIAIYKHEKVSGRFAGAVHLVSGVKSDDVTDAINQAQLNADQRGLTRYMAPIVLGAKDPTVTVDAKAIELASLPNGYDEETTLKWYIANLALGFGAEFQDFAPLPGGNLGTSAQSEILHLKARGKGPKLFMQMLQHAFNFHGVMPRSVTFKFDERDPEFDKFRAERQKAVFEAHSMAIQAKILSPQVSRAMLEDDGLLKHEYVEELEKWDKAEEKRGQERRAAEAEGQAQGQAVESEGTVTSESTPEQQAETTRQDTGSTGDNEQKKPTKATERAEPVKVKAPIDIDESFWDSERAELEAEMARVVAARLADVKRTIQKRLEVELGRPA